MTLVELRESARLIWQAGLDAANPELRIRETLHFDGETMVVGDEVFPLKGRLIVVGAGKVAARMAQVVEAVAGDRVSAGLVVTKYDHRLPLRKIRLIEAGHPLPDAAGVRAAKETRQLVADLAPEDIVLCLISGGASALWAAPAQGVSLEEKQEVTSLLLRAGAPIREVNAVRKHLSEIKGGQLARWAAPARVVSLIMSDVIGDPLDFIGSGPTAPDTTSFADALAVIQKYGLDVPPSVVNRLQDGAMGRLAETLKPGDPVFSKVHNLIIANNHLLVEGAGRRARDLRFNTVVLATEIEGEARDVGQVFAAVARESAHRGAPAQRPACILAAGETTVTIRGRGLGGRNQEMALAWAINMASHPTPGVLCFASVATDGTDGPTNAAGGLVDPLTCARAVERGLTPSDFLHNNDSYNFLKATGDLIVTGPTQTNLMDLQILLVG